MGYRVRRIVRLGRESRRQFKVVSGFTGDFVHRKNVLLKFFDNTY